MATKAELIKRWRNVKPLFGRLYWKSEHPGWNWDRGEVARVVHEGSRTQFFSYKAIEETIEWAEEIKRQDSARAEAADHGPSGYDGMGFPVFEVRDSREEAGG